MCFAAFLQSGLFYIPVLCRLLTKTLSNSIIGSVTEVAQHDFEFWEKNMPPKFLFTKEEIISAAVEVVRENGAEGLTARALAAKLGCSVKPIFGAFKNMEEVRTEVIKAAEKIYRDRLAKSTENKNIPPYKATGTEYIKFAKDDRELFKLLFMRDRSQEAVKEDPEEMDVLIGLICKQVNIDREEAKLFYLEMWAFTHGIASMIATNYLDWDEELISRALTDSYEGLKRRYESGGVCND